MDSKKWFKMKKFSDICWLGIIQFNLILNLVQSIGSFNSKLNGFNRQSHQKVTFFERMANWKSGFHGPNCIGLIIDVLKLNDQICNLEWVQHPKINLWLSKPCLGCSSVKISPAGNSRWKPFYIKMMTALNFVMMHF